MSEVVRFKVNTQEELHLAYGTGKACSGIRGPQFLYTLTDGRIAFADPPLDAQIQMLQPKSGARVSVTMRPGNKWDVVQVSPPAEQPRAATPPSALPSATQRAVSNGVTANHTANGNGNGGSNGNSSSNGSNGNGHVSDAPYSHTGWAANLRDQATSLIDVAASCHRYAAEKYPGMLRPEDVSALLTTVYIGMNKGSGGSR